MKLSIKLETLIIFFASLALFCYGLFSRELIGFETRFAVFSKEMLQHGITFFPTTYGKPYPDYPAGLPLLNYLCAKALGRFSTLAAILPSALAAAGTLTLLFSCLAPIHRNWARISILLCLFTYGFIDSARTLSMDPLIMFAVMWAFYVSYRQLEKMYNNFLWLSLPLIFGFIIRGPIGLVMPAAVIVANYAGHNQWRMIIQFGIRALILLMLLMLLLLIAAWHQGGTSFIKQVLIMQIFGRIEDHRTHEFFAYFTSSFGQYALSYELAIVSVILFFDLIFYGQGPQSNLLRSLVFWVLIIMIGMSIPEVRKIRYIMPMVPALAALAAYLWVTAASYKKARITVNVMNALCLALPFILTILTLTTLIITKIRHLDINAHYNSAFFCLFLLCVMSIYVLIHQPFAYATRNPKKVIGIGLASFITVLIFISKPIEVGMNSNETFINGVMHQIHDTQNIIFYQVGLDAEPIQFLATVNQPVNISYSDKLDISKSSNVVYITQTTIYDALPEATKQHLKVLSHGRLGHKQMVVFQVR